MMKPSRSILRSVLILTLLGAAWGRPATAQPIMDPDARLQLGGAFIGANELVLVLQAQCPGDYGDAPYGAEGALTKLKFFMREDEFADLSDYIVSAQFAEERTVIHDKFRHALNSVLSTTPNATEACRILAQDVLKNYATTKAQLPDLR
ncbi:MAG: hypothetical protein NUV50_09070 [Rhodospirillales bacterium]|nr:hypothetical protein [Rhodospirillales bacterium]